MASSSRILSRIPNFQKSFEKDKKVDLAESAVFKNVNFGSEDQKLKYLESFSFINSAFPFFIKKEHHAMASSEMKEGQGEYWGHAIHFLLSNKAHGFPLWNEFEEQMRSVDASFSCKPHVSAKTTNSAFEHYFEKSANNFNNALDFLMQDSVLVQLPFQPGMLFQWLTSSLHNVSLMEFHFSPFYYLPVPHKFKSVLVCLHKLLKTTQRNIGFLFDYLQCQITSKTEIFVGNLKVFDIILKNVIVFHAFSKRTNLIDFVRNLKINCWQNWKSDEKHFQMKKGDMPLRKRNYLFNPDFWRAGPHKDLKLFGNSNEQLVRAQDLSNGENGEQLNITELEKYCKQIFPPIRNKQFAILKQKSGFLKSSHKLKQLFDANRLDLIEDHERGILGETYILNYYTEFVEVFSEASSWIVNTFNISPKPFVDDFNGTFDDNLYPDFVQLPIEYVKKFVVELGKTREFLSSYSTLILRRTQVFSCDFQKRILDIVLNCVHTHLQIVNFENQKDDVLRDWQVVQYLLPCFVASYLNICESEPPVDESFKKWYYNFIDNLIGTYEIDGIRKSSWKNIMEDVEATTALKKSFHEKNNADLLKFFKKVTQNFNEKFSEDRRSLTRILKYCPSLMSLYEVLTNSMKEGHPQNDVAIESCVYWNWLMWDFFKRMETALELSSK